MRTSRTDALSLLSLVLGGAFICSAASITYNVNQTIGSSSVTGDIVTDGTIGVLSQADITGYDLFLRDGTSTYELNGFVFLNFFPFSGSDLSATPTQLLFNFSGTDGGAVDIADASLDFQVDFCTAGCFNPLGPGEILRFAFFPGFIFDTQFTAMAGTQVIGTVGSSIPEPSTLPLLGAGMVALFGLRELLRGGHDHPSRARRK